jgi:protoheme IX farnesyltransferase
VTPATTNALPALAARRSARVVARSLFALTKPRIIELLLVTTIPTMLLAARGLPSARLLVVTLAGGALAAGSANTINCYLDRDIDAMMRRTSRRPLAKPAPLAVIKPAEALIFGILLGAASTVLLGTLVNWLSAVLADAAILFYVFIYTIGLKRRTPSNIVIGGAAGCFPVLVGWSAVTGTVGLPAMVLFAVIFFWTPPHFWALAMKFRDDYAAASVPMLPVVAPPTVVARKILIYSYIMVAATLALAPYAGWLYAASATGLGAWFLLEAHRLRRRVARAGDGGGRAAAAGPADPTVTPGACAGVAQPSANPAPMRLFHLSIAYLTLLFAVIAVTSLLPWGSW